jgi:hypothetical protein
MGESTVPVVVVQTTLPSTLFATSAGTPSIAIANVAKMSRSQPSIVTIAAMIVMLVV